MTQKVILLKLVNGEEIIGRQAPDTLFAENWILEKVRAVVVQPAGNGQVGIAFVPFMFGDPDGTIEIPKAHVIGELKGDTPKNMEDAYLQQVSGLAFATQGQGKIQV